MADNVAVLAGFTEELFADCAEASMPILVQPGTDLDGSFKAWDMDNQEFVRINGWYWSFEPT
ncbi:hypothetical protein [Novosphingobium lindaniclasticum]|uniref:Uncharacterized protein n=1 Tax=Novosphingobium lindaniclasticum LE124 TaxID=1096930 RepID=T0ILN5_9SPHN|nr:hypothetical protein [Novosphingobium lindaniclasticum]EQB12680.1 hypothetical protein L284_15000 [Novosphingobium lindaniclasticum LE124]